MGRRKTITVRNVVALFLVLGILSLSLCGCYVENYTSTSLKDYERCIGRFVPWSCSLFPDKSLLNEGNCEFYDRFQYDGSNTPCYLTYLFCTFTEKQYQEENARLKETATMYSEELFSRPAYILCLKCVGFSEYALIDDQSRTIHYFCYSSLLFADKIPEEDRLLPQHADAVVLLDQETLWETQEETQSGSNTGDGSVIDGKSSENP